jgi:hypothetical protein
MAAADKSPHLHAGCFRRRHAADAVFDDECFRRSRLHPVGRMKKQIGRRLAARDHLRGVEPIAEMGCKAGAGKRKRYPVEIAGRRHAVRRGETRKQRADPRNRLQRGLETPSHPRLQVGRETFRQRSALAAVVLQHCRGAAPQEQIERFRHLQANAVRGQRFGQATAAQHLAVDEYAIAVKNDQLGPGTVHIQIGSYAHLESNSSACGPAAGSSLAPEVTFLDLSMA